MRIKTVDMGPMIKFGLLKTGDVFHDDFGSFYIKTWLHHCNEAGEFRTNCVALSHGRHACYWNADTNVFPCLKVTLIEE